VADLEGIIWRTSTASGGGGCVEVAFAKKSILVRDSKDRTGPILSVSPEIWTAFIRAARNGQYDVR